MVKPIDITKTDPVKLLHNFQRYKNFKNLTVLLEEYFKNNAVTEHFKENATKYVQGLSVYAIIALCFVVLMLIYCGVLCICFRRNPTIVKRKRYIIGFMAFLICGSVFVILSLYSVFANSQLLFDSSKSVLTAVSDTYSSTNHLQNKTYTFLFNFNNTMTGIEASLWICRNQMGDAFVKANITRMQLAEIQVSLDNMSLRYPQINGHEIYSFRDQINRSLVRTDEIIIEVQRVTDEVNDSIDDRSSQLDRIKKIMIQIFSYETFVEKFNMRVNSVLRNIKKWSQVWYTYFFLIFVAPLATLILFIFYPVCKSMHYLRCLFFLAFMALICLFVFLGQFTAFLLTSSDVCISYYDMKTQKFGVVVNQAYKKIQSENARQYLYPTVDTCLFGNGKIQTVFKFEKYLKIYNKHLKELDHQFLLYKNYTKSTKRYVSLSAQIQKKQTLLRDDLYRKYGIDSNDQDQARIEVNLLKINATAHQTQKEVETIVLAEAKSMLNSLQINIDEYRESKDQALCSYVGQNLQKLSSSLCKNYLTSSVDLLLTSFCIIVILLMLLSYLFCLNCYEKRSGIRDREALKQLNSESKINEKIVLSGDESLYDEIVTLNDEGVNFIHGNDVSSQRTTMTMVNELNEGNGRNTLGQEQHVMEL